MRGRLGQVLYAKSHRNRMKNRVCIRALMLSGTSNLEWHCRDFEISKFENLSQDQSCSRCSVYHRNCFPPLGFLVWHREQRSSVGRFPLCKTTHTTTFGGVRYILTYMMGIRTIPSQAITGARNLKCVILYANTAWHACGIFVLRYRSL